MKLAIHQPNYLPGAAFFKKMALCDTFVFLDDVQYEKNGWTNRNRIRTINEKQWLTVPVHAHSNTLIKDVEIDNTQGWAFNHRRAIEINYGASKNFDKVWPTLKEEYKGHHRLLNQLNSCLIDDVCLFFKIDPDIIYSSELGVKSSGSDRILDICRLLNADTYLSGAGGKNYLNLEDFANNDIDIHFVNAEKKPYKQLYEPFIPGLSELDFLMCGDY